jgi:RNA polymerase sigma-54 factor
MVKQQLNIKLKQGFYLTPSLQQSINILQMSNIELQTLVSQELSTNPFLKISNRDEDDILPTQESILNDEYYPSNSDNETHDPINSISYKKSLQEHIFEQINLEAIKPKQLAYFIAEMLDDNGYLKIDLPKIATDLKIDLKLLETLLCKLQGLDPSGIFARNLTECLTIQLKNSNLLDDVFKTILQNLDLVAQKNLSALAKICKINIDELKNYIQILQRLNPKPGASFCTESLSYKIPDVIIQEVNGGLLVNLNNKSSFDLFFDKNYYQSTIASSNSDNKSFLANCKTSANYLVSNIKRRSSTLLEVAKIITEKQTNFFLKGMLFFNPITLNEVAEALQMNESTISRTVANKYIKAPWGMVYEMKFFFSSSLTSKNSDHKVSSTKVKELIKQIIELEDSHPLSDEEISKELIKFNIKIARRTVAKYRESLNILKSNFRKK